MRQYQDFKAITNAWLVVALCRYWGWDMGPCHDPDYAIRQARLWASR